MDHPACSPPPPHAVAAKAVVHRNAVFLPSARSALKKERAKRRGEQARVHACVHGAGGSRCGGWMWDGAREHGLICERASGILRVPCVLCLWLLWVRVLCIGASQESGFHTPRRRAIFAARDSLRALARPQGHGIRGGFTSRPPRRGRQARYDGAHRGPADRRADHRRPNDARTDGPRCLRRGSMPPSRTGTEGRTTDVPARVPVWSACRSTAGPAITQTQSSSLRGRAPALSHSVVAIVHRTRDRMQLPVPGRFTGPGGLSSFGHSQARRRRSAAARPAAIGDSR